MMGRMNGLLQQEFISCLLLQEGKEKPAERRDCCCPAETADGVRHDLIGQRRTEEDETDVNDTVKSETSLSAE